MVEDVKRIQAELDSDALADIPALTELNIKVLGARSTANTTSRDVRGDGTQRITYQRKRGRVEDLVAAHARVTANACSQWPLSSSIAGADQGTERSTRRSVVCSACIDRQ